MINLFLTTIITCSQAVQIINRIQNHINLSQQVKIELIETIRQVIPTCPVVIKKDGK
jgi:predicted RND superfamily exporter protein